MVVEDYLMTITGKENMDDVAKVYKKIKGLKIVMKASISQGEQTINMSMMVYSKAPNFYKMEINAMGMVVQKEVFNGTSGGSMNMQTGKKELTDQEIKEKQVSLYIDKELRYDQLGYVLNLESIEKVEDKLAYKISVTDPMGNVGYEFYDMESKLKVSELKIETTSSGESISIAQYFSDYKPTKYYQYPNKIIIDNNGQEIEMNLSELEFNPKFSRDEFSW
jgi:outer membrane lipoprotein-sorting protein